MNPTRAQRLLSGVIFLLFAATVAHGAPGSAGGAANLATVATPTTSFVSGHETLAAMQNDFAPRNSDDHRRGIYGNWPEKGTQWVEYTWDQPISTDHIEVYWFEDKAGIRVPVACRLKYWDGKALALVPDAKGLGVEKDKFNVTTFPEITTTRLRLEMDGREQFSTGVIVFRVMDSGKSPEFKPIVHAGGDRTVITGGKTYLSPTVKTLKGAAELTWEKDSGPGDVTIDSSINPATASFSAKGDYALKVTAKTPLGLSSSDLVHVSVIDPPPTELIHAVETTAINIDSPFWNERLKKLVTRWIPHCIAELSKPDLKEGGIDNFVQAGNKLAGKPHTRRRGDPWADAFTHNTVESMCLALMMDAHGDAETLAAQNAMRAKLDEWIPILLASQEPDGYMQTRFTLDEKGAKHWDVPTRGDHEGYVAGYFIEASIAHYRLTGGKDRRLLDAAIRLADCWDRNIGPAPKQKWYDTHEELEMALVRLAHLVDEVNGPGGGDKGVRPGDRYVALARFLLECRQGGSEYDQSHLPLARQYRVAGHAVRAMYFYSGMTDIAMETRDTDYMSATASLWDSLVNRALYVTGGVGSGETSEGFGTDYALPNRSYCESCANCGYVFFQHRMNLLWQDAKFADLYEDTLYNAVLGDVDLAGDNFTYTNELDCDHARYPWHDCPCCVGNIPRTLLQLTTWTYATGKDSLYVNLFVGGKTKISGVSGSPASPIEIIQKTN